MDICLFENDNAGYYDLKLKGKKDVTLKTLINNIIVILSNEICI